MDVTIPCPCPQKDGEPRHESDTVTLRDTLDFHEATTITKAAALTVDASDDEASRSAELLATLTEYYVLVGVERWTLRDAANKPVEVTKNAVRQSILGRPEIAAIVTEAADPLYGPVILLPLAARASTSSQPTSTPGTTSPKPDGSARRPRKPSRRSSITTIPTAGTEATSSSLDGVSSSSQSSESAA